MSARAGRRAGGGAADRRHGNDSGDASVLRPASPVLAGRASASHRLVADFLVALGASVARGAHAQATWSAYRRNLRIWLRWLERRPEQGEPSATVVRAFARAHARDRAPASLNALLDAVRALYAWAYQAGRGPPIASAVQWRPYARAPTRPVVPRERLASLLDHLPSASLKDLRDRALVRVLLDTGLATISLHRADWRHLRAGTLTHQPQGHRRADARQRLGPAARLALARYRAALGRPAPRDPLFARVDRRGRPGRRLSTLSMRLTVLRLMERAGLAERAPDGRLLRPGAFSSASFGRSLRAGASVRSRGRLSESKAARPA